MERELLRSTLVLEMIDTHGIAEIDRDGRYRYVNDAYMRLHRWSDKKSIIGEFIYDLVPEAITRESLKDIMEFGEKMDKVLLRYRPKGLDVDLSLGWTVIKEEGVAAGAVIVASDITRETHAIRAERMVRDMYKSVCEDQSEIIIRVLSTGHIVYINEAGCNFFETVKNQLYGTKIPVHFFEMLEKKSIDVEKQGTRSTVYYKKNDRYIEYISRLMRDDLGEPFLYTIVGRDITDLVRAMQQMSQLLYRMLSGRERQIIDRLMRGMGRKEIAHDLQISTNTYDTLIARIKRRWGTNEINDAVELISKYHPDNVATNMW